MQNVLVIGKSVTPPQNGRPGYYNIRVMLPATGNGEYGYRVVELRAEPQAVDACADFPARYDLTLELAAASGYGKRDQLVQIVKAAKLVSKEKQLQPA